MKMKRRTRLLKVFLTMFAAIALVACPLDVNDPADPIDEPVLDTTAPLVNSTVPVDTSMDVALNATINATFNEEMDAATVVAANFSLMAGATAIASTVSYDAATKTVSLVTDLNLDASTTYTATLGAGVTDTAGNPLTETRWSFSTGGVIDSAPPSVVQVLPLNNGTDIAVDVTVEAIFSEGMDISTITTGNFTLTNGATVVPGTVIYRVQDKKAVFSPTANLAYGTLYTATVKTGAKDLSGNALEVDKVWTFTTLALAVVRGPAPVRLGTAGNYVILAKTAITTVPASAITGNIGLSPAAESYMTGFSQTKATGYSTCPQVTGYMYAADMTPPTPSNMTIAVLDMQAAYTDAAGRADARVDDLSAGTIGGLTFAPGLYHWGSNILLTADIYIDGASNDVWIFQSTDNIIVSSNVKIILSGGAQAKNVFWQAAGYAKLGTGSHFEGNILSQTQINLETGASLNGRALAQTQVTLDANIVTKPVN